VLEDLEYEGLHLRQGSRVSLLLGAANRDPAQFPNPDRLDLGREKNAHVSFGGGIHYCLGAPLARLELQIALPLLLERLPRLQLTEIPQYRNTYHFHGLESLLVTW
jgi:unspecific monooxygenase